MTTIAVRERLQLLADKNGGLLTPDAVVADAAKKNSPLHAQFEWDDDKAAASYRIDQARALIRSIRIVVTTETTVVNSVAYVRDPRVPADEQGYISVLKVRTDKDLARDALVDEFSRAAGVLRRARELAVALDLAGEVDAVINEVEMVRTKIIASVQQRSN